MMLPDASGAVKMAPRRPVSRAARVHKLTGTRPCMATDDIMTKDRFQALFLLALVLVISGFFVAMIRPFLVTILLAAILSAILQPLFRQMRRLTRGRSNLAASVTLVIIVFVIVIPLLGFLGILANQALHVSESMGPRISQWVQGQGSVPEFLARIPGIDKLEPYRDQIVSKLGEIASGVGSFLVAGLSSATRGTLQFLFHLFLLLYASFFFLKDGREILRKILLYAPLRHEDEVRLLDRFVSVTRATLKGTILIGVIQGAAAGLGFAVAGIASPIFWGTLMAILSIIPGIGIGLVWVPWVIYLIAAGKTTTGVLLAVWCGVFAGTADNFLRPRLVGKDAQMSELLILLGTLGGILLFGIVGFVIGPIVAALFVTIWDIYGIVFRDYLPEVKELGSGEP
jgi:predicted PurR-regulated permease PerM